MGVSPILDDTEKMILADWARHPGADIARRWLLAKQEKEEAALGAALFSNPASWDPVAVAHMGGRHKGRIEVLNHALFTAKAVERAAAKANQES